MLATLEILGKDACVGNLGITNGIGISIDIGIGIGIGIAIGIGISINKPYLKPIGKNK